MPQAPLSQASTATAPADITWDSARGERWLAALSGMEAMLSPVDEPLIRALRLDVPCRVAEIGSGGGGTTHQILQRAPPGSVVHGFDISPALVEHARRRAPLDARISFDVADMAKAAPAAPYDRLVSRFGIMFFDDPHAAFTNLSRWLTAGGRFAFAAWAPLADNPWFTTARDVVAGVVDVPPLDPQAPGAFRFAQEDQLVTLLEQCGFGDVAVEDWRGAFRIGGGLSPAEAARFALASFSSFAELLDKAGNEALLEARRSLTARFEQHQQDGAVIFQARVHIFTGGLRDSRRPARE